MGGLCWEGHIWKLVEWQREWRRPQYVAIQNRLLAEWRLRNWLKGRTQRLETWWRSVGQKCQNWPAFAEGLLRKPKELFVLWWSSKFLKFPVWGYVSGGLRTGSTGKQHDFNSFCNSNMNQKLVSVMIIKVSYLCTLHGEIISPAHLCCLHVVAVNAHLLQH